MLIMMFIFLRISGVCSIMKPIHYLFSSLELSRCYVIIRQKELLESAINCRWFLINHFVWNQQGVVWKDPRTYLLILILHWISKLYQLPPSSSDLCLVLSPKPLQRPLSIKSTKPSLLFNSHMIALAKIQSYDLGAPMRRILILTLIDPRISPALERHPPWHPLLAISP